MLYTQDQNATLPTIVTHFVTNPDTRMAETPGSRLYLIRLAHGDGVRRPEPLRAFALRVKRATGEWYDPSTLSLLERDEQAWKVRDTEVLSTVDPRHRGAHWLAFGEPTAHAPAPAVQPSPVKDHQEPAKAPRTRRKAR